MTAALEHWAAVAPQRIGLAERSGEGWRTVTFAEAHEQVSAIAGALLAMGVVRAEPLLILSGNGIDPAQIAYAAMTPRMPVAPVLPQSGMRGATPTRLALACAVLTLAAVFVQHDAPFTDAIGSALVRTPFLTSHHIYRLLLD